MLMLNWTKLSENWECNKKKETFKTFTMTDFLHTLFNPLPNGIMTVLMLIIAIYWVFVLIGGIGFDDIDLDIDFSPDIDVDVEVPDIEIDVVDTDSHIAVDKIPQGLLLRCLSFINVGQVPFMIILSTFIFLLWIGSLITTHFFHIEHLGWRSVFILLPLVIVGFLLTKAATTPMAKFFKEINYQGEAATDFFGCSGKMLSNIDGKKVGSAEFLVNRNPIKLNVVSLNGDPISYGDTVIITEELPKQNIYIVIKDTY